jgi:hypothetical protein
VGGGGVGGVGGPRFGSGDGGGCRRKEWAAAAGGASSPPAAARLPGCIYVQWHPLRGRGARGSRGGGGRGGARGRGPPAASARGAVPRPPPPPRPSAPASGRRGAGPRRPPDLDARIGPIAPRPPRGRALTSLKAGVNLIARAAGRSATGRLVEGLGPCVQLESILFRDYWVWGPPRGPSSAGGRGEGGLVALGRAAGDGGPQWRGGGVEGVPGGVRVPGGGGGGCGNVGSASAAPGQGRPPSGRRGDGARGEGTRPRRPCATPKAGHCPPLCSTVIAPPARPRFSRIVRRDSYAPRGGHLRAIPARIRRAGWPGGARGARGPPRAGRARGAAAPAAAAARRGRRRPGSGARRLRPPRRPRRRLGHAPGGAGPL